ncbi:MAG: DoxX family protein [Candidatus Taylorbacteria bacterium]|nr:DoxX family protein [Candidatus Taylorbacteria bacterium]
MNRLKSYAPVLVRVALSLVFLWFGYNQLAHPDMWIKIVPAWAGGIFGSAAIVVTINGWFEIVAGLLLIAGIQVRIVSLLLGLHLISIASGFGLSAIGIRDWGLCLATFSIFLNGPDIWSLDSTLKNKVEEIPKL